MKNNQFDNLNYEKPKYNPLDDFKTFYKESGKSKPLETPDPLQQLRELNKKNPEALSPLQRLTLGMAELNEKNEAESQAQQQSANEQQQEHDKQKAEDKELISMKSEEYQELTRNIAALQQALSELSGNGGGE